MSRYVLVGYCLFVAALSFFGAHAPHSELSSFLTVKPVLTDVRLGFALLLLIYSLSRYFRPLALRFFVCAAGLGLITASLVSLFSYSFLGLFSYEMLPIDFFIAVEGGILALIVAFAYEPLPSARVERLVSNIKTYGSFLLSGLKQRIHAFISTNYGRTVQQ
jgi:hypothetical protein